MFTSSDASCDAVSEERLGVQCDYLIIGILKPDLIVMVESEASHI